MTVMNLSQLMMCWAARNSASQQAIPLPNTDIVSACADMIVRARILGTLGI